MLQNYDMLICPIAQGGMSRVSTTAVRHSLLGEEEQHVSAHSWASSFSDSFIG